MHKDRGVTSTLPQLFTGGTGRSGTTILGVLLGKHPAIWATLPREMRILTDEGGLLDLVIGGTRYSWLPRPIKRKAFLGKIKGDWWLRVGPDGTPRGLHRGVDRTEFEVALKLFEDGAGPLLKRSQALVSNLFDPPARRHGASMWVDTTPANAMHAHRILKLLPDARLIQVVRDGRDAASSVLTKNWGPNDPMKALEWWRNRMIWSHEGVSKAPAARVMTIRLEDLLIHERDSTYKQMLDFLGLEDHQEMSTFFNTTMSAENGHPGRWATDIPAAQRDAFAARYEEIWHELHGRGLVLSPL
jgi:hypothetical protein